jgi:hypothetical protein
VELTGTVVARERERLGVMIQVPGREELLYLVAREEEVFRELHPGLAFRLEVEGGQVQACSPTA